MSRGTLYGALDRLERKGFVEFEVEPATGERGGRRRRRFHLTAEGLGALEDVRTVMERMWEGMDERLAQEGA